MACDLCKKLQTNSCPRCNKRTIESWKIAVSMSSTSRANKGKKS